MKTHFKLSAFEKVKRIRLIVTVVGLLCALQGVARDREQVWPSGKMPDAQEHQIAAMTDETSDSKFKPEKHRIAYLEWFEKPDPAVANERSKEGYPNRWRSLAQGHFVGENWGNFLKKSIKNGGFRPKNGQKQRFFEKSICL